MSTSQAIIDLLNKFCGDPEWRKYLSEQAVFDGWRVATDMRILCAVKTEEPDYKPHKHYPNALSALNQSDATWDSPYFVPVVRLSCNECNETGVVTDECDRCMGFGWTECMTCGHECDCKNCGGDGKAEQDCDVCAGNPALTVPDGTFIAPQYYYLIQTLPNATILHCDSISIVKFDVEGLEGRCVVMRKGKTA